MAARRLSRSFSNQAMHSSRFALALALAAGVDAFGSTPYDAPKEARTPFTFDVSGGGFRTMTAGMAFSRALSEAFKKAPGSWGDVTHISGNSGGQWFATQFAYSSDFNSQLTKSILGLYIPLRLVLAEWAAGYAKNLRRAVAPLPPLRPGIGITGRLTTGSALWLSVSACVCCCTFALGSHHVCGWQPRARRM